MRAEHNSVALPAAPVLRVIEVDPRLDPRWEAFATSVPASPTPFYNPTYLRVMEEAYGHKAAHLLCEDTAGNVVGILPLFYRQRWRGGRSGNSVFIGPLAYDDHVKAALLQGAVERTRAEPGARLHLKVMSNALDGLVEGMVGAPAYKIYMVALPEHPELLRLDPPVRRAINKASRSGVVVRRAQSERDVRAWYEIYLQTMRKRVVMPQPYRCFELQWRRLYPQGHLRLLLAEHCEAGRRRLLGGNIILLDGPTVSCATVAWRQEDQALRPNDVLHWQAMQDACAEGFRWYDLGDADLDDEGLARYKSKWGSAEQMVYDYAYPVSHPGQNGAQNASKHARYRIVRAAWPHLPANVLGRLSDWYYALHL